jgi:orotate phosphoribosyltransferase
LIEGPFREGDQVAVIEDVITTGGSALRAISAVRSANGVVAGVLALVDRDEGGTESIQALGVPVISLVSVREILDHLRR